MALVNGHEDLYEEMYDQLPGEVIEEKIIMHYEDMIKFSNTKVRLLLQMLVICSFIVFQPDLCTKVLNFAEARSLKVAVTHD